MNEMGSGINWIARHSSASAQSLSLTLTFHRLAWRRSFFAGNEGYGNAIGEGHQLAFLSGFRIRPRP